MAKQVLIIDDDRNTVKYLSVVLSEHGYDPVAAYDGSEGPRKVKLVGPEMFVDKPVDSDSFVTKGQPLIGN